MFNGSELQTASSKGHEQLVTCSEGGARRAVRGAAWCYLATRPNMFIGCGRFFGVARRQSGGTRVAHEDLSSSGDDESSWPSLEQVSGPQ
eukprot:3563552-Amphidinium_carterae.1